MWLERHAYFLSFVHIALLVNHIFWQYLYMYINCVFFSIVNLLNNHYPAVERHTIQSSNNGIGAQSCSHRTPVKESRGVYFLS